MSNLPDRFWAKVDKSGECWLWTASTISKGYGCFRVNGGTKYAHRLAYECLVGPIPEGLQLDHLCRTPRCVNPAHLDPVTPGENTRRGALPKIIRERSAAVTHCPKGHEYTQENTRRILHKSGYVKRSCRECHRAAQRIINQRLKQSLQAVK